MSENADVLVVGGGIIGTSTAHELAALGRKVVLLEAERLASGTTGASFAWLNATAKSDDEQYHRLNVGGVRRHLELAAMWGEEAVGLAGAGSIHWSHPSAEGGGLDELQIRAETLAKWGYPIVELALHQLAALEPYIDFPQGSAGFLAPMDRWLDAPRLTRRLAEEARLNGADIREGAPVTGFLLDGDTVVGAETPAFRFFCDQVVLACGPSTSTLIAMARRDLDRVIPIRRSPGLLVEGTALERRWLRHVIYFPDAGGFHARPGIKGGLLIGADDIDERHAQPDSDDLSTGVTALLHRASTFMPEFPALQAARTAGSNIGVRPMPADGLPVLGSLPGVSGVYVAATHSGITLGPHLGELIAKEVALGQIAPELDPYRPVRFSD